MGLPLFSRNHFCGNFDVGGADSDNFSVEFGGYISAGAVTKDENRVINTWGSRVECQAPGVPKVFFIEFHAEDVVGAAVFKGFRLESLSVHRFEGDLRCAHQIVLVAEKVRFALHFGNEAGAAPIAGFDKNKGMTDVGERKLRFVFFLAGFSPVR